MSAVSELSCQEY